MALPVDTILEWIKRTADGESVSRLIREAGAQSWDFWGALDKNPDLANAYALATRARSELLADEIIDIVDSDDNVIRARNRADARRWLAGKLQPQKYGDAVRLDVTHTVDIGQAMELAKARALPMRCQSDAIEVEYAEESIASLPTPADKQSVEAAEVEAKPLPDLFD